MESYRKAWNKDQTAFRDLLLSHVRYEAAIQAFLQQHARLHSAAMAPGEPWSYEDWLLEGMSEAEVRHIPAGCEHSVAWALWHIARIEDVTMNMLIGGEPQLAESEGWFERLGVPFRHTGNGMGPAAVAELSARIDLEVLRAYRQSVGRRTRAIVCALQPPNLHEPVRPERLQQVLDSGAVTPEARSVVEYWGRRDVAGLLLMPPTRHCYVHLNEAQTLKSKKFGTTRL